MTYRINHGIVPHPTTIQISRCNEKASAQTMVPQHWQSTSYIILIAIVEGHTKCAPWQITLMQALHCLGEG
jgi:hypothetical protein